MTAEALAVRLAHLAEIDAAGYQRGMEKHALGQRGEDVAIPATLATSRSGMERAYQDARYLYRVVALSGAHGVLLRQLKLMLGSVTFQEAQKVLRRSGAVVETKEPRKAKGGRVMDLLVLRTAEHAEDPRDLLKEDLSLYAEPEVLEWTPSRHPVPGSYSLRV